jgi:hypothetical protein
MGTILHERRAIFLLLGSLLVVAAGVHPYADRPAVAVQAVEAGGAPVNPHSDLIFRATGAKACVDCHRTDKAGVVTALVQDNDLVRDLKAKAKGVHGPGRFADCLRCHAGGSKGVEKYGK